MRKTRQLSLPCSTFTNNARRGNKKRSTMKPPTIILRSMLPEDHEAVGRLSVGDQQQQFVDPMPLTLGTSALLRDNMVIEHEAEIVGFFQIDTKAPGYIRQPMLELCQVVIDQRHQGKGFGKGFLLLLPAFLKQQYPAAAGVVLTVNCRNKMAHHVYSAGGFHDTGEIYTGGPSGPQHIMTLSWSREV